MRRLFLGLIAIYLSLVFCGCFALLIGGGIVGGIAISKDTAKLEVDTSYDRA